MSPSNKLKFDETKSAKIRRKRDEIKDCANKIRLQIYSSVQSFALDDLTGPSAEVRRSRYYLRRRTPFYIKRAPFLRLCGHMSRFDISSLDPCKLAGASDTPVLVSPRSIDITHISSHDAYSCARGCVIGITSF